MPTERALIIPCAGEEMLGIYHEADAESDLVAIIVVGGPQYRVGSHRMFVQLARYLAGGGIGTLRFDVRGMGDSGGSFTSFQSMSEDIRHAVNAVAKDGRTVAMIGLCDGATATALYARHDVRVKSIVLINPWVHTTAGEARARVRNYYARRILQPSLWKDVMAGRIGVVRSVASLLGQLRTAVRAEETSTFVSAMRDGLSEFRGDTYVILSEDDLVAQEFDALVKASREWAHVLDRPTTSVERRLGADHTFSGEGEMAWLSEKVFVRLANLPRSLAVCRS